MKQTIRTTSRGFTLTEVVVSLFVFTIIMTSVAQIFSTAFSGFRVNRAVERDVQNAQYAINIMAKELRTGSVVSASGNRQFVQFFDHSQGKCFRYRINAGVLQVASADSTGVNSGATRCDTMNLVAFTSLSTGTVTGSFRVTPSTVVDGPPAEVGRVTIILHIADDATHVANIQTTISLRDFGTIGL
jgi:prepilin-type N-terminal cleavage/methylation domain-containing protein